MATTDLLKAFGAFFAIMNPFLILPFFLAMTSDYSAELQRSLATRIVLYSAIMALIILVAGDRIIAFFGVDIDRFRIAGGIVLSQIAMSMLNGSGAPSHSGSDEEKGRMPDLSSLAFYPITFPLIIGPGTIATLIIYAGHAGGPVELSKIAAIVGVVLLMLFAVLFFAGFFGRVLTETMRVIMGRLMGMILLAIAVEMVTEGVKSVFPGLVS